MLIERGGIGPPVCLPRGLLPGRTSPKQPLTKRPDQLISDLLSNELLRLSPGRGEQKQILEPTANILVCQVWTVRIKLEAEISINWSIAAQPKSYGKNKAQLQLCPNSDVSKTSRCNQHTHTHATELTITKCHVIKPSTT